MIKKLRRKFVAITMVSVLMVLVLIMGVINIINYVKVLTDADSILSVLIENGGTFPSQTDKDNTEAATDETSGSDV